VDETHRVIRIHRGYLFAAIALFVVLVGIAVFVRDGFVRPFLGDVLVVVWVYAVVRAVVDVRWVTASLGALGLAFAIELGQWFGLVRVLGLEGNPVARVVLGATFDVWDLAAYCAGWAMIVVAERAIVGE